MTINENDSLIDTTNDDVLAGAASVSVQISDGGENGVPPVTQTFQIAIENTNDLPVISSTPDNSIAEDSVYQYSIIAIDEDPSSTVSISSITLPSWLNLNGTLASRTILMMMLALIK